MAPLSTKPRAPEGLRLLVVEATEAGFIRTLDLLSGARGASYSVDWVTSAEAARSRTRVSRYDLILVDHALGGKASLALVRHCALQASGARTLLLSEQRNEELARAARRAGADAYLVRSESGGAALERAIRAALPDAEADAPLVAQGSGLRGGPPS